MATINVLDSSSAVVALEKPLVPGAATAALSRPVAIATDQINLLATAAGQSSQLTQETNINTVLGIKTDAKNVATDGTSISMMQVLKQMSASLQALNTAIGSTSWDLGVGTSGTRTQRVLLDTSQQNGNGQATMANSTPVVIASDQASVPVTFGGVAHDAADSGAPTKIGFRAINSISGLTLVANNDRTDGFSGLDGVHIVRPHTNLEDIVSNRVTDTTGTQTTCISAAAAGIRTYVTSIVLCNTSVSNITVDVKDGSTTKITLPVPATSGCVFNPPVPLRGTAATPWNFQSSAGVSTLTVSMVGFLNKV